MCDHEADESRRSSPYIPLTESIGYINLTCPDGELCKQWADYDKQNYREWLESQGKVKLKLFAVCRHGDCTLVCPLILQRHREEREFKELLEWMKKRGRKYL